MDKTFRLPTALPKKYASSAGFTLIEILIVMIIIGVLTTLAGGSFMSSQQKGRDARRKNDLKQVSNAIETYYNDKGQYPTSSGTGLVVGCNGTTADSAMACNWGEIFQDANETIYMVKLPTDPRGGTYFYSSNGSSYQLYARLENTRDASVSKDSEGNPQVYSGVDCGSANCNYGISSPNTTPEAGRTLVDE